VRTLSVVSVIVCAIVLAAAVRDWYVDRRHRWNGDPVTE
jgi:hypothetical protein